MRKVTILGSLGNTHTYRNDPSILANCPQKLQQLDPQIFEENKVIGVSILLVLSTEKFKLHHDISITSFKQIIYFN